MKINNKKGVALAITLLVVLVLIILGAIFVLRAVNEKNIASYDKLSAKAFYVAEGGANAALETLDILINTDLLNTINGMNPQLVSNRAQGFVTSGDGLGFFIASVKKSGVAQFTLNGSQAEYIVGSTSLGDGNYNFKIIVTEKNNPYTSGVDQWDFPYYYRIETTGNSGAVDRDVILTGDFTVRVQRDNFAKFALFTDHHSMPNGTTVWFTDKTDFAGPIHTNEQYSFAFNPSGIFDGSVTQHLSKARFYNNGFPILADADSNPGQDVPVFNAGYTRSGPEVVLASSVQKQDLIDQARGGDNTPGNGIFVANDGANVSGGIYVNGNASVDMGVDANDNATYTIIQGATTKVITVDKTNNQTTVLTSGAGSAIYGGLPDGLLDLGT
ncbi:MAG: DUF4900 domain-containing protein, partial [Candidatus Omnitrophota bacterium]